MRSGIAIARIELDGSLAPGEPAVIEGSLELPRFAVSGSKVHFVYGSFGDPPGTYWVELSRKGASSSGPSASATSASRR